MNETANMNDRSTSFRAPLVLAVALLFAGCAQDAATGGDFGRVSPPEAPTTGNKWVEDSHGVDGSRCFVLQDEECGGIDDADYLAYFEAPIFRSAHAQGGLLYAVDGSNVWMLDLSDPIAPQRVGLAGGVGRALAVAGQGDLLYVAAGERGIAVFRTEGIQTEWTSARLVRVTEVALPGPALDVSLRADGRTLYAAAGKAGLVAVALDEDGLPDGAPVAVAIPGFASGVAHHGLGVYVAGCSGLTVVSAATLTELGTLPISSKPGQAPVPVKDVAVDGNVAAVAAGRWGMFFVDVSDPRQMRVLGNRTESEDLLYYGNGVTASHGHFYLAAGDWGVDRVPVHVVANGYYTNEPTRFPRYCTSAENPDRKPATEFVTSLPPPRNQDPLDVIVVGDHLYAAGDASRLGLRAIDAYSLTESGVHTFAGRYEEPRAVRGVAAGEGSVVVAGPSSGVYAPVGTSGLLQRQGALPEGHEGARTVAVCGGGRVASLSDQGELRVEGALGMMPGEVTKALAPSLAASGEHLVAMREAGQVEVFRVVDEGVQHRRTVDAEHFTYGAAHAFVGDRLFVASAAWSRARSIDLSDDESAPQLMQSPVLTRQELEDPSNWRQGAPARVLVPIGEHLAEVASFGGRARAVLHPLNGQGEVRTVTLPPGTYVGGTAEGARLVLVQGDRARYRTAVVEVDLSVPDEAPVVRMQVFPGSAVGAARLGDVLYVADYEAGVRAFRLGTEGVTHLGVAALEAAP